MFSAFVKIIQVPRMQYAVMIFFFEKDFPNMFECFNTSIGHVCHTCTRKMADVVTLLTKECQYHESNCSPYVLSSKVKHLSF